MKAVLISINPNWCAQIANGNKVLEVRKNRPKLDTPFRCYIYCTAGAPYLVYGDVFRGGSWDSEYTVTHGRSKQEADRLWGIMNGKIIGEFICNKITEFDVPYPAYQKELDKGILEQSCLTYYQLHRYAYHKKLYGWHISDLVIYDEPKPLSSLYKECEGLYNTGLCWECERAVGEECDCAANGRLYLTRPPQSWCYVEGLNGL